ncbi:DUF4012 domain-containing protein [Patescibacteria group bacterium]
MNHQIQFRKSKGKRGVRSMVFGTKEIRITRIPESNVIDLRQVSIPKEQPREQQPRVVPEMPVMTNVEIPAQPVIHSLKRKKKRTRNLLFGFSFRRTKIAAPPPLPTLLEKEPAPPPLVEEQSRMPIGWVRSLVSFTIMSVILLIPVFAASQLETIETMQGRILGASTEAYDFIENARDAIGEDDYSGATVAFRDAEGQFTLAQEELLVSSNALNELFKVIPQVASANHILKAGRSLSIAGQHVSDALASISQTNVTGVSFVRQLEAFSTSFHEAAEEMNFAIAELEEVDDDLIPSDYQGTYQEILSSLPEIGLIFNRFLQAEDVLFTLLGVEQPQRSLFIFQNNAEVRPTGGFIGSLALVDIEEGLIRNLEIPGGGSYDIAGQLKAKVISPTPLHLVNPHWNIQDANWFPDYPSSAKKIMWFYEHSGGPTVDSVVSVTPTLLESFLELTGPVIVPAFNETVTSTNVVRLAQVYAEEKYDKEENQPKKFIAELFPILLNKVFTLPGDQFLPLVNVLNEAFMTKDILIYFYDADSQLQVAQLGWDGGVRSASHDYLMVVHTNIGGGKTDKEIENLIDVTTQIDEYGNIINTLQITRSHTGDSQDTYEGIRNVDYLRVYVPGGSILLDAEGFDRIPTWRFQTPDSEYTFDEDLASIEGTSMLDDSSGTRITQEFGKTVFGNWLDVGPGETRNVSLTYRLPFKFVPRSSLTQTSTYSILVQKQAGVDYTAYIQRLYLPADQSVLWSDERFAQKEDHMLISEDLSTDRFFGLLSQKK